MTRDELLARVRGVRADFYGDNPLFTSPALTALGSTHVPVAADDPAPDATGSAGVAPGAGTDFARQPFSSGGEDPDRPSGCSTSPAGAAPPGGARHPSSTCPVCEGGGTVMQPVSQPDRFGLVDTDEFPCDQCDGTGEQR